MNRVKTYIVRQPILDGRQHVLGYEILYNGDELEKGTDENITSSVEGFLTQVNSEAFLDNEKAFFTLTPSLLEKRIPQIFDKDKLVIQIDEDYLLDGETREMVAQYHEEGYEVVVLNFSYRTKKFGAIDFVDYIKLDFGQPEDKKQGYHDLVKLARGAGKKVIGYKVDTDEALTLANSLKVDYLQGMFIGKTLKVRTKEMNYLQSNFFQLLVEVTKEEPDLDIIEEIVSRDVTLTFSLLKLVNSAYFALHSKVKSVRQALSILGFDQMKRWVYLLTFKNGTMDVANELIKTSFLRGTFCHVLVPYAVDVEIAQSEAYLMGMFSTLDMLMGEPIDEILSGLPISQEVKLALSEHAGNCGLLYDLVLSYERADWAQMTALAEQLQIPPNILTQKYFECVESVNTIWKSLMGE